MSLTIVDNAAHEQFQVQIEVSKELNELFKLISDHTGQEQETFRLICRGKLLSVANGLVSLEDLGVNEGDTIQMFQNLRSSRPQSEQQSDSESMRNVFNPSQLLGGTGVINIQMQQGDNGPEVVQTDMNGDLSGFQEMLGGLGNIMGENATGSTQNILGNLFSNIFQRPQSTPSGAQDQQAAEVQQEQPTATYNNLRRETRPQTRRSIQRNQTDSNNSQSHLYEFQSVLNQIQRESLTQQQIVQDGFNFAVNQLQNKVSKITEGSQMQKLQKQRQVIRLCNNIKAMVATQNPELFQLLELLEDSQLSDQQIQNSLKQISDYLKD